MLDSGQSGPLREPDAVDCAINPRFNQYARSVNLRHDLFGTCGSRKYMHRHRLDEPTIRWLNERDLAAVSLYSAPPVDDPNH
jgi:hypothetical protein